MRRYALEIQQQRLQQPVEQQQDGLGVIMEQEQLKLLQEPQLVIIQ